jgi:heterodisulfide reductase subunit A-like polyferredoxin
VLSKDKLKASGVVSVVDPDRCAVCLTCVRVCPYNVPVIGDKGAAEIDPLLCRGCGSCASDCPGSAIQLLHFRDAQLDAKSRAQTHTRLEKTESKPEAAKQPAEPKKTERRRHERV